ncbi:alpha/beta hydrolase family protein [Marinicrinis sediminis]|uniref:Alpha/beta hydrolase family protein n=1 Tax=Marinicrinis sediminis TaxID=1652465 RepID=A0ABW5RB31_9BACL
MKHKTPFQLQVGTDPDRILRGDVFSPPSGDPKGIVIICHGYKGFKDWGMFPYTASELSDEYEVVTFNFSHNGVGTDMETFTELEKFAHNTYSRELEDLGVLIEAVSASSHVVQQTDSTTNQLPIYLLGHSRGAGVSLLYALDHPEQVDGVISWNGIGDVDLFSSEEKAAMWEKGRAYVFNSRTQQHMPLDVEILKDMERNREQFDLITRISELAVPAILIQGSEDFTRLKKQNERLREQQPRLAYVQIPEGNHTFLAVHPFKGTTGPLEGAIAATKNWLSQQIQSDKDKKEE